MTVLCSLLSLYETFVDKLLYEKDNILLEDVSNILKSKELKKDFRIARMHQKEIV